MFLVGGAFVTCLNFNAIYANENMIKPVTLFFISYTSTALVMRIFFGWIPDKIGRIQTCLSRINRFWNINWNAVIF